MEHIIQFSISVEDDRIVNSIENNVEKQVIRTITDKVEDRIYEKRWGKVYNADPLIDMIHSRIDKVLADNTDLIIDRASKILAEKLARSKAGKAILEQFEDVK